MQECEKRTHGENQRTFEGKGKTSVNNRYIKHHSAFLLIVKDIIIIQNEMQKSETQHEV